MPTKHQPERFHAREQWLSCSPCISTDVQAALRGAGAEMLGCSGDTDCGDGAFAIMRDALQELLARDLDPERLHFGKTLNSVVSSADGVDCTFGDGGTARFDVLVGCDGIGSAVKGACFPRAAPPVYSGVRVLFAVAPAP
eukprot:6006652-Pleurochrysis_carterae.AAC.1